MGKRVTSKEELREIERLERLLATICWSVRKTYGIQETELRSSTEVADPVDLSGRIKIKTDELPKIVAYLIAKTHEIPTNLIINCTPIIQADNRQQAMYRIRQFERKGNLLLATADQATPGSGHRRAILAISMALRLMSNKTLMPVRYE